MQTHSLYRILLLIGFICTVAIARAGDGGGVVAKAILDGSKNQVHKDSTVTDWGIFGHNIIDFSNSDYSKVWGPILGLASKYLYNYLNAYLGLTVAHEIGHTLGLQHSDKQPQVINQSFDLTGWNSPDCNLNVNIPPAALKRVIDKVKDQSTTTVNDEKEKPIWQLE